LVRSGIDSGEVRRLPNVAFQRPEENLVLIVVNEGKRTKKNLFNQLGEKNFSASLNPGAVGLLCEVKDASLQFEGLYQSFLLLKNSANWNAIFKHP